MGEANPTGAILDIDALAVRQLVDYDQRRPGMVFEDGLELTIEQGYALQAAVTELRQKRGEKVVGYKVGCTSSAIRSQLGIKHCITGSLFDTEQHPSGVVLSGDSYSHLACEGELAIELSRPPSLIDFQSEGIPDCVERVFPVIELHQYVTRSKNANAAELIANNAIHAGVVTGNGVKVPFKSGARSLSIFRNDTLVDACSTEALITTIRSSLRWLMQHLNGRDGELRAGEIILTGSLLGLYPMKETCRFKVESEPFGVVEAFIQY